MLESPQFPLSCCGGQVSKGFWYRSFDDEKWLQKTRSPRSCTQQHPMQQQERGRSSSPGNVKVTEASHPQVISVTPKHPKASVDQLLLGIFLVCPKMACPCVPTKTGGFPVSNSYYWIVSRYHHRHGHTHNLFDMNHEMKDQSTCCEHEQKGEPTLINGTGWPSTWRSGWSPWIPNEFTVVQLYNPTQPLPQAWRLTLLRLGVLTW